MNRKNTLSSNFWHGPGYQNYELNRTMTSLQPAYSPDSYIYYPWVGPTTMVSVPSVYGPTYQLLNNTSFDGTSYNMHGGNLGLVGPLHMPMFVLVPFVGNVQHQIPSRTNWARTGSTFSPRPRRSNTRDHPTSRSGFQGRSTQRNDSLQTSSNTHPGSNPNPNPNPRPNSGLTARVSIDDGVLILDLSDREEEPARSTDYRNTQIDVTVDQRVIDGIIAMLTPTSGLADETITRQLTTRISEEIPTSENNHEEADCCVICLDGYEDQKSIGKLDCGHEFHTECIRKWLRVKNECPICKSQALLIRN